MFISNFEKSDIQNALKSLRSVVAETTTEILYLKAKIKALEEKPVKVKKPKKPLTLEQKAKQREYQKMYKARKKAELETQGTTNVSA